MIWCFRPLAGLSCINPVSCSSLKRVICLTSFRPLAGLSCINLVTGVDEDDYVFLEFPSPRGVELHKPRLKKLRRISIGIKVSVPSRG